MGQFRYICIRILTQCRSTSHCKDVQSHFLDVNVYKWMLSSTPIEVEVEGKPGNHQDSDNVVCVTELEKTSLACGSNSYLVPSENQTPSLASDPDLLNEQQFFVNFWTPLIVPIVTTMWL